MQHAANPKLGPIDRFSWFSFSCFIIFLSYEPWKKYYWICHFRIVRDLFLPTICDYLPSSFGSE